MPLENGEQGALLDVPNSNRGLIAHARTLLKSHGHNVTEVCHVYGASNPWWSGYELLLYTSYKQKRTAYLYYEGGSLKIRTVIGWFDDAADPPAKKTPRKT